MNKFKKALSIMMIAAMAVNVPVSAYAAPKTSVTSSVKKRTISKAEKNVLLSLFDAEYYAAANPDVAKAFGNNKTKLFNHFIKYGMYEGRSVSAEFNANAYKAS